MEIPDEYLVLKQNPTFIFCCNSEKHLLCCSNVNRSLIGFILLMQNVGYNDTTLDHL